MFAHVLTELLRMASQPCYLEDVNRKELGENLIKAIQPMLEHLEIRSEKFLLSNQPTYIDFMLYELSERIQFISEGQLYAKSKTLEKYCQNVQMLPKIVDYIIRSDEALKASKFNNKNAKINNN